MALASVLERLLPVNWHGFFRFGSPADFLDLGPGSSSDGLSLAVPGRGVPEEGHIEMLHGTIQAFKFQHEVIVAADSQATVAGPWPLHVDSERNQISGAIFSVGSGSVYAYGLMDQGYSYNLDMKQAYIYRDAYSGGAIHLYHVLEGGWIHVSSDSIADLHDKYSSIPEKCKKICCEFIIPNKRVHRDNWGYKHYTKFNNSAIYE
uniref:Uncharacterized protein n=1 Tax=Sciurus vulgaris TaxID=55149 RepID=A0A8D2DZY0_SCIVU